jgi:hypothetical protein
VHIIIETIGVSLQIRILSNQWRSIMPTSILRGKQTNPLTVAMTGLDLPFVIDHGVVTSA